MAFSQPNGMVKRFNRTLAAEWAYAEKYLSDEVRSATYQSWLYHYNRHRSKPESAASRVGIPTSPGIAFSSRINHHPRRQGAPCPG
ncbi:hypothetical protein CBI38_34375 (plasmid) [Rhodococcus oxybenzonivorans]|uniref:Integrase catalytic domain-containing protein n=1 Tax=Rhodococcus oxybenzonivorans TaxID=1990687 RepID=A0A2S2C6R4_9NOCA|nr:hypothetical protein CBI38_34375 [Rhodococcus oxybenzonivorans]